METVAKFIVPDWGDEVDSCRRAVIPPSQRLRIWPLLLSTIQEWSKRGTVNVKRVDTLYDLVHQLF
jgi:hypothetical protein